MNAEPVKIIIGDFCRYDGRLCELVAIDGLVAKLRREDGQLAAVKIADLFADSSFDVFSPSVRRRPIPPDYFSTLPNQVQERVLWLEHHISEVVDGTPIGSPPQTEPRNGYDVRATSLGQRERNKCLELEAAGTPLGLKYLQELRRRYERSGVAGLIDGRLHRRRSPTRRVDDRYVGVLLEVLNENELQSTRTEIALKWHVDRRVVERFNNQVKLPSHTTFHRLMKQLPQARHATGSARTRQTRNHQPEGMFSKVVASRPGEWMQIDTTPFDVGIRLDDSVKGRVELTGLVDAATRTIVAAVLRPTTKAVDASLLLAKSMTPEPMRPGWVDAVRMSNSVLPYHAMRSVDDRLDHAAARPIIIPENIVYDSGAVYLSTTFRSACRSFGISMQPAHKDEPTDKPIIERTLGSVKTLFAQYVTGYLGSSVENRGKHAEQNAVFSLQELQDLLDEWIVVAWQNRPHDGLRDPLNPQRKLTPNEKYASMLAVSGYIPAPLSSDQYVALLPSLYRTVTAAGITIDYRVYDSDALDPARGEISGVPGKGVQWQVHYDPYDVSRVWVHNHHGEGYLMAHWTQLQTAPQPFGSALWEHARQLETSRGERRTSQEAITAAVEDLLGRASVAPESPRRRRRTAKDRRVVARTRAAAELPPTVPPTEEPPGPFLPSDEDIDDIADVIPLPVFDAEKESNTW
ncbi:Mu transposase C-terminal domain-containing protein [Mycobacterium sp. IDR2000157661]|uniref:Mu transposase C-terminal domain-containing protein n=1 Tax=Mycobacterium sp. IDR2000157661 TaxID=2867005 RepID=UPI001EE9C8E7|nr:Mu transposase C-terminal domain-containing protein [Mycobacterium sp. IDR2000157661]ULE32287.1 Mu transposase C-terminal domain-containing protein [Mycobacterium sp. IDR2000157661]